MSNLIRPFLKDRPISATIRVDRDTIRNPEPESRIFSRVARNAAGDLWTLRYLFGLPVLITLQDSRRRTYAVYQPSEPQPTVSPCEVDPAERPEDFPPEAPAEAQEVLVGIPCFHRHSASDGVEGDVWYSYDYAALVRTMSKIRGYGTTIWYLDEVSLEEPPAEIFAETVIRAFDAEYERNLWTAAARVFRAATSGESLLSGEG